MSSDCQINDFENQAQVLSSRYAVPNSDDLIAPPSFPYSEDHLQSNVEPLRVIGPDERGKIYDTTIFPWTTVVKIEGRWNSSDSFVCTGWMLGPSTVVTAGHCVYNFNVTKTFAYDVTLTPALNTDSSNSKPFGNCYMLKGLIPSPWYENGDIGYDYGVYYLGCTIGYKTGHPGFKMISGSANGTFEALPGYPADKGGTTMWTSGGTIQQSQTRLFYYDNDMTAGQSGAPVWITISECNPCVIAINAQEYEPPTLNSGPRITTDAFNFFISHQQFIAKRLYLPFGAK